MGVDPSTIWNWERGWSHPELRYLPAIIAFLGYDPRPKPASPPNNWFGIARAGDGHKRGLPRFSASIQRRSQGGSWERRLPGGLMLSVSPACLEPREIYTY